jgi:hypothetical protein
VAPELIWQSLPLRQANRSTWRCREWSLDLHLTETLGVDESAHSVGKLPDQYIAALLDRGLVSGICSPRSCGSLDTRSPSSVSLASSKESCSTTTQHHPTLAMHGPSCRYFPATSGTPLRALYRPMEIVHILRDQVSQIGILDPVPDRFHG